MYITLIFSHISEVKIANNLSNSSTNIFLHKKAICAAIHEVLRKQKLSRRKVVWFLGLCHNVGKTSAVLILTRMKTTFFVTVFIGMLLFVL